MNLEELLAEALERALKGSMPVPAPLADSIRYSLLAPGKRIRPRLLLATAEMLGLGKLAALPAALAVEMIHCFTLIHDDLPCMDNSPSRRGLPSNHIKFGEATALLAGDALIAIALDTFSEASSQIAAKGFVRALKRLCWALGPHGVIGGQAAEPLLGKTSKLEDLMEMHAAKTGALFTTALLLPADLLEMNPSSKESSVLEEFAKALGSAFQIADDLEDASSGKEAADPKNILYFVKPKEAQALGRDRLLEASTALKAQWSDSTSALLLISDSVQASLGAG